MRRDRLLASQVRELKAELAIDLLFRQGGRMVWLTEAGARVVTWARRSLRCVENVRAVAKQRGDRMGGSIAIAKGHAHARHVLRPTVGASVTHPVLGNIRVVSSHLNLVGTVRALRSATPDGGSNTEEILCELGCADEEISDLIKTGVC